MSEKRLGYVSVLQVLFFAEINQLDVTPYPAGRYDEFSGYMSQWKLRDGTIVGLSDGGTHLQRHRYWLSEAFIAKHTNAA